MERLSEKLAWAIENCVNSWSQLEEEAFHKSVDRLAYYEDLEEQGRLVVLPCKVGDKLYDKSGKVAEVEEFWVDKRNVSAQVHFQCDYDCNECAFNSWHTEYSGENSCDGEYGCAIVPVDELGKSVFLTREEAEAALKREV